MLESRELIHRQAHLVFRFVGNDTNSPFSGKVLRLRKRRPGQTARDEVADLRFAESVVQPLLEDLALPLQRIDVDRGFLSELAQRIEPLRDAARLATGALDVHAPFGVLAEDLSSSTRPLRLSVEIKVRDVRRSSDARSRSGRFCPIQSIFPPRHSRPSFNTVASACTSICGRACSRWIATVRSISSLDNAHGSRWR